MWKCKSCKAEDSIVAEGYEKNRVRWVIDKNGKITRKVEEYSQVIVEFYECDNCKKRAKSVDELAEWEG